METLLTLHRISAVVFLLIYLIKTFLLVANQHNTLERVTRATKVTEMIVSTLFLVTGVWMFVEIGSIKTFQIYKLVAVFAAIPLAIVGFKKKKKALAVISLLLIIAAYGLAEMSKKKPYPVKEVASTASAQEIYKINCASCHGDDGTRQLGGAKDLSMSMITKDEAKLIIAKGKNNMAGFESVLSPEQIDAVAEYVQTLKK